MLPPKRPGALEPTLPPVVAGSGATAMMPMKGFNGTSTPGANRATFRARSNLMILGVRSLTRVGATPPGPGVFTP